MSNDYSDEDNEYDIEYVNPRPAGFKREVDAASNLLPE